MRAKIPKMVLVISTITVLFGLYHILNAMTVFYQSQMLRGYATPDTFQILGLIWLGLGLYSIIISIGLDFMKLWARLQGVQFFFWAGIFCIFMYFTDILMVVVGVFYLIFCSSLTRPYMVKTFETFEYEKLSVENIEINHPSIMKALRLSQEVEMPEYQKDASLEANVVSKKSEKPRKIRVPENMVICPNCDMLNQIDTVFCVRCALDIDQLNKLVRKAFTSDEDEEEEEAPPTMDHYNTDQMQGSE